MDVLFKIGISLIVVALLGMLCALPIVFPAMPLWLTMLISLLVVGIATVAFVVVWREESDTHR